MPIYEYRCDDCGHELELMQKYSDKAKRKCPECGKPKLKKLLSVSGLKFIGSGFYCNDYPSENPPMKK